MPKTRVDLRLSDEAKQNIKTILEKYNHLATQTDAIEFAVWLAARSEIKLAYLDESGLALKLDKPAANKATAKKEKAK